MGDIIFMTSYGETKSVQSFLFVLNRFYLVSINCNREVESFHNKPSRFATLVFLVVTATHNN